MLLDQVANEISELGDRLEVVIFFGGAFNSAHGRNVWHVEIKLKDGETSLKADVYRDSLQEAMSDAWKAIASKVEDEIPF